MSSGQFWELRPRADVRTWHLTSELPSSWKVNLVLIPPDSLNSCFASIPYEEGEYRRDTQRWSEVINDHRGRREFRTPPTAALRLNPLILEYFTKILEDFGGYSLGYRLVHPHQDQRSLLETVFYLDISGDSRIGEIERYARSRCRQHNRARRGP